MNRVWAYTISRSLNDPELENLLNAGNAFVKTWTAHDQQLSASFEIFRKKIILVKVNEEVTGASGCSIDKLTRFVKETEQAFRVELMNRLLVAHQNGENIEITHASKIKELLNQGTVTENTIVYNTSLANDSELMDWEQPLKNTWLNKYLQNP